MIWRVLKVLAFMLSRLLGYLFLGVFARSRREAYVRRIYVQWARYSLEIFSVELEVMGRELVPPEGTVPRIFLVNHQSQLDIPAIVAALGQTVGFVAKQELSRIPILAYWMRKVGCVFIDRSNKREARASMEKAAEAMAERSFVVFPEGTRSKTGEILPIKLGGLRMAILAGAQVVPVRIRNTRAAFESRKPGMKEPMSVQVQFFPHVDTRGMADEKTSWLKIKDYLEECWGVPSSNSAASSAR